ncbi:MAG TPA: DinB family protein [Candidatus Angelobacter sp.]|nr:DinB family protein [Candidatus Angelobacter sp.]
MASAQANLFEPPAHLRAILDDFEKADQDARRIAGGLTDAQGNWQPRETAWSVAQCLDHMARGNTLYAAALRQALNETGAERVPAHGPIQPGWFGRYFIRTLDAPPNRKMQAPKKIVPASQIAIREALQAFLRSQEDMRGVIRDGAGFDLNRIRFRNPFVGFLRFTVGTGLLIIAAHNRRHLWQAQRVLECPGFPKN